MKEKNERCRKLIDLLIKVSDKTALPVFFIVVCLILFKGDLKSFKYIRYVYYVGFPIAVLGTIGMIIKIFKQK